MSFPTSFRSNSFERMIQFLNESNQIESINQIDYHDPKFQKVNAGHFAALVQSQESACQREPLSIRQIEHWQALLTEEQKPFGHFIEDQAIGHIRSSSLPKNVRIGPHVPPHYEHVPTLLDDLVEQINEELKHYEKFQDDAEYCKFLGRIFQKFEEIHPFTDGNGRTGRLLANYIATYCRRPIIVFNSEMKEKNQYYAAHKSPEEMSRHIAKKVQEVVFGLNHELLFKTEELSGATFLYQSSQGNYEEQYEWHTLRSELDQASSG